MSSEKNQEKPGADPLADAPFVTPRGLPDFPALSSAAFAALPKKKMSTLFGQADGRSGDALRARLAPLTNCACYLVCLGSLGIAVRRAHTVIDPKLWLALGEAIFAYQHDWRYPKPFGITMDDLDAAPPDLAIRRAFAHAFFSQIARSPSFFLSGSAQPAASYVVALTRHLFAKEAKAYDAWLDAIVTRLEAVARNPSPEESLYLPDYPSREAWESAVRVAHGKALPLELLDLSAEVPPEAHWSDLYRTTFRRLSPEKNPLLEPHSALIERGLASPYETP